MNAGKKSEIARVSEIAWRRTLDLAASVASSSPPASLHTIANSLSISRIRFAPLISDAGLAKIGRQFEIVVNADATSPPYASDSVLPTSADYWMDLRPALRFTVAHEIAHLIFLQAAGDDQQSELFQKNERAVENACNILARVLLLPSEMLRREIASRLFDAEHLVEISDKCRVSPEVLVRRFHVSDVSEEYDKLDGFIALAHRKGDAFRVKACHIFGAVARDRFHRALRTNSSDGKMRSIHRSLSDNYAQSKWALEGQSIEDIQLAKGLESKLRDSVADQISLRVGWGGDKVVPCKLSSRRLHEAALLLCLQVVGPVQESGEERLL